MAAPVTLGTAYEANAAYTVDRPKLLQAADLAVYPPFLARVTSAAQRVALEIGFLIKAMDTVDANDKARWIFCHAVLSDPVTWGARFAWSVASLEFMDRYADDATLATQVSNQWDIFAGIPV